MKKNNIINKLVKEISQNRLKILDDFCKAYLASRWEDYFSKQKKIDFKRLELVEWRKSPTETIYYFRLKKGKIKQKYEKENTKD
jgi:hypothetical protein